MPNKAERMPNKAAQAVDDWQDVPVDDWQDAPIAKDAYYKAAGEELSGLGGDIMGGVNKATNFVDRYSPIGASLRAGIGAAQTDKPILKSYFNQFLKPAGTAPTGKDIMNGMGASEEEFNTPLIGNPFTGAHIKVSPAGLAGGAFDAATDLTNWFPGELAAQGIRKSSDVVAKAAPKLAESLGRFAEERAVKAATGENRAAIKKIAKVEGKGAGDVNKAVANMRKTGRTLLETDAAGAPAVGWFSNAEDIGRNAAAKRRYYGEQIGKVGETVDRLNPGAIKPGDLALDVSQFQREIPDLGKSAPVRKRVGEEVGRLERYGLSEEEHGPVAPMSFKDMQEIKGQYPWNPVSPDVLISDKDATNRINRIVSARMDQAVEGAKAGRTVEKPIQAELRPYSNPVDVIRDGKPSAELGRGYTLVRRNSNAIKYSKSPASQKDAWDILSPDGKLVGTFHAEIEKDTGKAFVRQSAIEGEHAGQGLGTKVYDILSKHYGGLGSDHNLTSPTASHVYEKLGARKLPESLNAEGKPRLFIDQPMEKTVTAPSEEDLATLNQYGPNKEKYGVYKNVQDAGTEQAMRTLGRRLISPSSHAVGLSTGMATAGNGLKNAGVLGAAAAVANQVALSRGAAFAARASDAISKRLMSAPQAYQKWIPAMQEAARAGASGVVGLHHQLMSNDPQYRQLMMQQAEEP